MTATNRQASAARKTGDPRVTVLMPAYNAAPYIAETLQSIFDQTFGHFELLVIDDGSTDDTALILEACRDRRLRVLRNPRRLKLAGTLNRGMAAARGPLIARMDADDRMARTRLEHQVAFLDHHPAIGCCGGWVRAFGNRRREIIRYPCGPERLKAFSLFYTPFAHPTVMFRNAWFTRHALQYDGSFYPSEDYELWSRALAQFAGDNLASILADYRQHADSMTGGEWTAMDGQTVRIHQRNLTKLGIDATVEEAQRHRRASMGTLDAAPGVFPTTEAWLLKLRDANRNRRIYDADALDRMLEYVWFRMTMGVVRSLGLGAWRAYRRSPLAGRGLRAQRRHGVVCLAALKAAMIRGKP